MPNYYKAYKEQNLAFVHQRDESVKKYDKCRYISNDVLNKIALEVLKYNPKIILEAGVGNGRLFLPILNKADPSIKLIGIDISELMLNELSLKLLNKKNIDLLVGDIRDISFFKRFDKNIDLIYTFATLHILSENWKNGLNNLISALSQNGKLILGEEINSIFHGSENLYEHDDYRLEELKQFFNEESINKDLEKVDSFFKYYHKLRDKKGYPFLRVNGQVLHGDQSPAENYLRSNGFYQETIQGNELSWIKPHSFEEIIYCIEKGTVTTLGSDIPFQIRGEICNELKEFCKNESYNLEKILKIPSQIQLHLFRRKNENFI